MRSPSIGDPYVDRRSALSDARVFDVHIVRLPRSDRGSIGSRTPGVAGEKLPPLASRRRSAVVVPAMMAVLRPVMLASSSSSSFRFTRGGC